MADLNIADSFENVNSSSNITNHNDEHTLHTIRVVAWIIISISLPLTVVAFYLLVRDKHVLVYVINLIISGVIQLCCLIAILAYGGQKEKIEEKMNISIGIYWYAEIASIDFMVCVAFQRYLAIAHPLRYRFSRSVKVYVVVCVVAWLLPVVFVPMFIDSSDLITVIMTAISHLLPFPFFLLFLIGAVRALSAAVHLNSVEKRRIIGTLALPVLIYSLLFIPFIISIVVGDVRFILVTFIFLFLSPLTNVILYVFIRKGFMDKVLVSLCCCKMDKNENSTVVTSLNATA